MNSEHVIVNVKAISYIHYKIRNKWEEEKLFFNGVRIQSKMFELKNLELSDIIHLLDRKYHWTWYLQQTMISLYHHNNKESILNTDFFMELKNIINQSFLFYQKLLIVFLNHNII